MISAGCFLLVCLCLQVSSVPLSTQLSEEEEKVTKCIVEVLVDSMSKPSPGEVSSECLKILKEDERILAMMHHQHLLKELEDLAHRENSKHRLGHEGGHSIWESEKNEEEELKKRNAVAEAVHQKGDSKRTPVEGNGKEEMVRKESESKQEHEDVKEFEKSKTIEETIKEHKVSEGEKETRELLEEAKELLEDEEEKRKRSSPENQWTEDFEDDKRNGKEEKRNKGFQLNEMLHKTGGIKRLFSEEEGSLENGEKYRHGEFLGSHHHHHHHHHQDHHGNHQDWDKEEEEEDKRSGVHPKSIHKRMDEKASDEETAQFEAEEKGVKVSNSKTHLHGVHGEHHLGSNLWKDKRHFHHHQADSENEELRKRHHEEEPHHNSEAEEEEEEEEEEREEEEKEEEEEEEENEERELDDLKEIEFELKKTAEKLGELHRG
ncbi:coiled-coil domain-containing glutamate-rich protein 2 [Microcaecilia unicolor]|uniref:Coiled-coil domain-containing glutamate-rich protein 2 n=1 Tax=Microcaecilia unicolor TaxID=1415580 RepID=A0A6P7ZB72_9AMPH|nr:coiled-coil domain-containing glutamate-rich protein 2 [Microcaecilia unicolor]